MPLVAAAAIGVGGSLIAANSASKSQAGADAANRRSAADTNAANERLFRLSRGGVDPATGTVGNAVLPEYFGAQESQLGQDTLTRYKNLLAQIDASTAALRNTNSELQPSIDQSLQALQSRYNGGDLAARIAAMSPVFQARTDAANAQTGAINSTLAQTLAGLNAQRSAQGYFGSSTMDRNRALLALLPARSQAAAGLSNAGLSNASDLAGLRLNDLTGRQDTSALASALQNIAAMNQMPLQNQINLESAAQNPLNFFRIGTQAFQQQSLPGISPTISTGQAVGQGLGALGGVATSYYQNQQLLNALRGSNPGTVNTSNNFGSYVPPTFGNSSTGMFPGLSNGMLVF